MLSYFPPTWLVEGDPFALGFNGRHGPFTIRIARWAPDPAAVWAQERYEWGYKWRWGLAAAMPVIALAVWLAFLPLALAAFAVALWFPKLLQGPMELRGHAIEVAVSVALYGAAQDEAEAREVRSLLTYRAFRHRRYDEVLSDIVRLRRWAARRSATMGAAAIKRKLES